MFKITNNHGFHITFENGYTVSVEWGPGNYRDNYNMAIGDQDEEAGKRGSTNAECAVWAEGGDLLECPLFDGDTVSNRSAPEEVLALLNWAAAQPRVHLTGEDRPGK